MKAKLYWAYALRSMARGGSRTMFAIFCITVGVLTIVALQLTANMIRSALTTGIATLNGGDIAVHSTNDDMPPVQLTYFQTLQKQGIISAYSGVVETGAQQGGVRYVIDAVDPATYPLNGPPHFLAPTGGNLPSLLHGNDVVLTSALLRSLNAHVGETIGIGTTDDGRFEKVHIVGVLQDGGLLNQPTMLINTSNYSAIPSLSGVPITLQWVYVNTPGHTATAADQAAGEIRQHVAGVTTTTVAQAGKNYQNLVTRIRYFLQITGLLALLIGGVGIVNTMRVQFRRRQLELAMLKTMGYRQRDLILMFGIEAALIGLLGGAIGALAGIGVMFGIRALAERAFFLSLQPVIDPMTIIGGIAIGFFTTLIFGLLPIVQTSRIRPMDVIRDQAAGGRRQITLGTVRLVGFVAILFFVMAASILQSPAVALAAMLGAGLMLTLVGLAFSLATWFLGKMPVLDRFRVVYTILVVLAIFISAAITLTAPGFGVLLLALALCGIVIVLLPRPWKASVRLALRNTGRQKARSASTLIGLFVGVFGVAAGLVLTQNVTSLVLHIVSTHTRYDALVLVRSQDKAKVDQQLSGFSGIQRKLLNETTGADVVAIKGVPVPQYLQREANGTDGATGGLPQTRLIVGVAGYPLVTGAAPDVTIVKGQLDTAKGRNLGKQDAQTTNVLLSAAEAQAPYNLRLGDNVTIQSMSGSARKVLTVTGFYTSTGFTIAPILADNSVVTGLPGSPVYYAYSLYVNPNDSNALSSRISKAVPSAQIQLLSDISHSVQQLINNISQVLEAIAILALVAGLIGIANAVGLAMLERRREIGMLKAIGYRGSGVLGEVLIENGMLGAIGAIAAMLIVTLFGTALGQLAFNSPFSVRPLDVLGIVVATIVLCTAIAGVVAWRPTRVPPLEVLRYE
jgi:putative ABC transport system permease protein